MEGQSSASGSERASGNSMPPYQPLRKTRLYELRKHESARPIVSSLNPTASSFKSVSLTNISTSKPFFEEDYPSQRFRPAAKVQQDVNDYYYSPPFAFIPSESSVTTTTERSESTAGHLRPQTPRNLSTFDNTGVTIMPGHMGNLTILGAFDHPASRNRTVGCSVDRGPEAEQGDAKFTPISPRDESIPPSMTSTDTQAPYTLSHSAAVSRGNYKSRGHPGIPFNISGDDTPREIAHQTKTFTQLAQEQGFRDWNNSVFDDRWLLQPGEMYEIAGGSQSDLTVSPGQESKDQTSSDPLNIPRTKLVPSAKETAFQAFKSAQDASDQSDHGFEGQYNSSPRRLNQPVGDQQSWSKPIYNVPDSGPIETSEKFIPPPPEAERLEALICDIGAGKGPSGLPYSPRIIRRYFYERCFGNGEGPPALNDHYGAKMTVHRGTPVTVAALRAGILNNIEDLILYLLSPVGEGLLQTKITSDLPLGNHASHNRHIESAAMGLNNPIFKSPVNEPRTTRDFHNSTTLRGKIGRPVQDRGKAMRPDLIGAFTNLGDVDDGTQREQALDDTDRLLDETNTNGQISNSSTAHTHMHTAHGEARDVTQPRKQVELCATPSSHQNESHLSAFGRLDWNQIDKESSTSMANDMPTKTPQPYNDERCEYSAGQATNQFDTSSNSVNSNSFRSPANAPWSSLYNSSQSTPFQSPQHLHYASQHGQQTLPQPYASQMTPAQIQYSAFQQMRPGGQQSIPLPWSQMNHQQIPPAVQAHAQPPGGCYGPNGIWVPNDRYIRPPATNRIAPMFAQGGAWQANQPRQSPGIAQHLEWQNRFGSPAPAIPRDNRKMAYVEGSDDMYPQPPLGGGASVRFQNLTRNQPPGRDVVTNENNVPFVETARASKPAQWGVMKIGNIPYDLTKASVTTFLGNHAKLITPELGPAIHIIMDRATGKTQDCYVEFFSTPDANAWVNVINSRSNTANRIGDRVLEVQLSSQDELLKELFPRAKNVRWEGGKPIIVPSEDPYNSGFKTFVSAEELQILVRHAEQPHRSNYTLKCPNRPYEAMISLLTKFPWQATTHYTLSTRNKIFHAARQMLHLLCLNLRRSPTSHTTSLETSPVNNIYSPFSSYTSPPPPSGYNTPGPGAGIFSFGIMPRPGATKPLHAGLLRDLLSASLNAAGFSEKQRWELYHTAELVNRSFLISPLAKEWPFEVLGRKRGMEEDLVEWYAHLIASHPLIQPSASSTTSPFGNLSPFFLDVSEEATIEDVGEVEWNVMVKILLDQCPLT